MKPSKIITTLASASITLFLSTVSLAQAPTEAEDMPPLMPVVSCEDDLCQISLSGVFNGKTLMSEPLAMPFSLEGSPYWQPRLMSEEAIKIEGYKAPYAWLIGDAENVMEIFLTPLAEPSSAGNAYHTQFMVQQVAGFEHVGRSHQFLALNFRQTELKSVRTFGPNAGPQYEVTSADTYGVRLRLPQYNPDTGDFDDAYTQYEWYSGADSMMLASETEMEEINAQMDILTNEP